MAPSLNTCVSGPLSVDGMLTLSCKLTIVTFPRVKPLKARSSSVAPF